jgi:two-component system sensor histidine kinase PhcS
MRTKEDVWLQKEFQEAFVANERRERIRSGKVASALVVFLMPAGIILDRYVYPERWADFLLLRLLCSGLAVGLWALHNTSFGSRHYLFLGIPIALLPAFFISWMIGITEGPESPYYAGLILILLAVNAIVHWSTGES